MGNQGFFPEVVQRHNFQKPAPVRKKEKRIADKPGQNDAATWFEAVNDTGCEKRESS